MVPTAFAIVDGDVRIATTLEATIYDCTGEGILAHVFEAGAEIFRLVKLFARGFEIISDYAECIICEISPLDGVELLLDFQPSSARFRDCWLAARCSGTPSG